MRAARHADALHARLTAVLTAFPGAAIAVVTNGAIVREEGSGYANIANAEKASVHTPFAIGSISKQFTAAAILLLVQSGRLSLDDRLDAFVPSLPNAATITLRTLLWHTAGLHDSTESNEHPWPTRGTVSPDQLFAILATDEPDFEPGTAFRYSNVNYIALAHIVALASRMHYGTFLKSRIFSPLGMKRTLQGFEAQQQLAVALPYETAAFIPVEEPYTLDLLYGAGDIVSTAHDLALWNIALMERQLLTAESFDAFWSAGRLEDGRPVPYAMGWVPDTRDGVRELWHNGYSLKSGGYCYNAIVPEERSAVTVLTNLEMRTARPLIATLHPHAK